MIPFSQYLIRLKAKADCVEYGFCAKEDRLEFSMKHVLLPTLILVLAISGCGPSEADIHVTETRVAAEVFGTQTEMVLRETITPTMSLSQAGNLNPAGTATLHPTFTPPPPPPAIAAEEVEMLQLCYKAAVIVQADWAVHDTIIGNCRSYSDDRYNSLNAFLWERSNRSSSIRVLPTQAPISSTDYFLDGVELQCGSYMSMILGSAKELRSGCWGVGSKERIRFAKSQVNRAARELREQLLAVDGIGYTDLDRIRDPIWFYVRNRYDVEIPY
jgi:hypothetical protein